MKSGNMRLLILLGLVLPLAALCQKRDYKRGLSFEKQGEISVAMAHYKAALYKNMYFAPAKAALERCANTRIESLLSDYFVERQQENWEKVQKISEGVLVIRDEMKYFSIEINLPDYQKARLTEDRQMIEQMSRDSPRSEENLNIAEEASQAFRTGNYFLAYNLYGNLLDTNPENKDYAYYQDQSKAKGSVSMAVAGLEDPKNRHARSLKAAILSALAQWSHPLLTIVEREDLDMLIREQQQVFTGLFEEKSTASPGLLKGVKHLLLIRLEDIKYSRDPGKPMRQTAYEEVRSKDFDEAGNWRVNTRYLPRQYTEINERASMTASLHYELVEVETGNILIADKVFGTIDDMRLYSSYHGNVETLFPVREGEIVISGEYVQDFRDSFRDQRILKGENQLLHELEQQLAGKVATDLKEMFLGGKL